MTLHNIDIPCTFLFLDLWARHTNEQVSSFPVHAWQVHLYYGKIVAIPEKIKN